MELPRWLVGRLSYRNLEKFELRSSGVQVTLAAPVASLRPWPRSNIVHPFSLRSNYAFRSISSPTPFQCAAFAEPKDRIAVPPLTRETSLFPAPHRLSGRSCPPRPPDHFMETLSAQPNSTQIGIDTESDHRIEESFDTVCRD